MTMASLAARARVFKGEKNRYIVVGRALGGCAGADNTSARVDKPPLPTKHLAITLTS